MTTKHADALSRAPGLPVLSGRRRKAGEHSKQTKTQIPRLAPCMMDLLKATAGGLAA